MATAPERDGHHVEMPSLRMPHSTSRGHVRWIVCGLLFFATTVNYVDRQVLGILKPVLQRDLHWSESDFGWVVSSFQLAYALMMPLAGRLIDRLGTRLGYALAVLVWSLASIAHSIAHTTVQFMAARFALGIGEASNFPAAIKAVAEWFPQKERALATGIFNSGSNAGVVIAALIVPFVAVRFGWRSAFLVTGGLDLIWLAVWLIYFRKPSEHRHVSKDELSYIQSGGASEETVFKVKYAELFTKRAAWAFIAGKFLTDPVWWFYLFWIPGFLHRAYGLNLTELGPPLIVIYVAADGGSVAGGWLSSGAGVSRLDAESSKKNGDADLRGCGNARDRDVVCSRPVAGGSADWARRGGASRMVGESVHAGVGHISQSGRRIGCGARRFRWRAERNGGRAAYRLLA